MRFILACLSFALLLHGSLSAADEGLVPPPMGPSSTTSTTPAGGNTGNNRNTNHQPTPGVTTGGPTATTLAANQPTETDNGIVVNPKPATGGNTPTVAANAGGNGQPGGTPTPGQPSGATGGPGNGGNTAGTNPNVDLNFQVFDLALGASQEFEIANNTGGAGNYQFPSGGGMISMQIGTDGSVTMTGVSGTVDLQCQTKPMPIAGVMSENQQLKIIGVTKFIAKKVDNKIFISLRVNPETITISYKDLTPADQETPKANYVFRFLMVGQPPILIVNGQTIQLVQGKGGVVKKTDNTFAGVLSLEIYKQNQGITLITGGSLLGYPASP